MKSFVTILLLLISTALLANGQQRQSHASLNRAQTKEAERQLARMGYWTGTIDGVFDSASQSALIAFQKYERRAMTGHLSEDELEAIRASANPNAMETRPKAREVGYAHIEVDLERQVLLVVNDDGGVRVLPVSTGNDKPFVADGQTSVAYTPRGRFLVYDKGIGWETGPLGSVYYANYISGGVAIHGFRTVPTEPASHGCIRIPMFAARAVSKLMPVGTIVLVYDKVSFVSAKSWVENPKLKEAALLHSAATDYIVVKDETKVKPVTRKPRPRLVRT